MIIDCLNIPCEMNQITVGCDPEFELIRDNKIIRAYCNTYDHDHALGSDIDTIEIRPQYSIYSNFVINKFEMAMLRLYKQGFKASIKGAKYPLGGHIHIGFTPEKVRENILRRYYTKDGLYAGRLNFNNLVSLMDWLFGKLVMDLSHKHRKNCGYGKLTDSYTKYYGIEYRTPPSTIFHNRIMLSICFKIAKRIAYIFCNNEQIDLPYPINIKGVFNILGLSRGELKEFLLQKRFLRKLINSEDNIVLIDYPILNEYLTKEERKVA